jgi:hypothetical protein
MLVARTEVALKKNDDATREWREAMRLASQAGH